LASASIDEVARRVGPVIQWHLMGYPAELPGGTSIDNGGTTAE
jgi:hypothetical protein